MAAVIPTHEPTSIVAGDTVRWTRALSDYSYADGWRLTYQFRGASVLDVTGTADTDGIGHAITISASDSAMLAKGQYQWAARVALTGEVYTVDVGVLTVYPNLSKAAAGDLVASEEKELALINAQIQELLSSPLDSYSTALRTAAYRKLDELYTARGIVEARLGRKRGQSLPSREVWFLAPR